MCVWWSISWFRELWTHEDGKVKSCALAKTREGCVLVVSRRGWLSLTVQAVDGREVGVFLFISCHFCFLTGKLLIWVDLHLKTLGGSDWQVCLTWRWRFNTGLPPQFSCDLHAAKCYPMLFIREHPDIFFIQKCSVACRASREWSKNKQANNVFLLAFSGLLWEKVPSFPPLVQQEGQQSALRSSYAICLLRAVCRLSRKQIKIQMCRLKSEQEKKPSEYWVLCYKC